MRRIAIPLALAGVLLSAQAGAQSRPGRAVMPPVDSALVFGPARGTLVVQLVDSAQLTPLPGGVLELLRGAARFQPSHYPRRDAPTEFSVFESLPAGPYVLSARRIGYQMRSVPVVARASGADTVRVALDYYRGCDICGEVVTKEPQAPRPELRPKSPYPPPRVKKP
jgi:hypothetical protein